MMAAKPKIHIEYNVEKELTEELDKIMRSSPILIPLVDKITLAACFLVRMDDNGETHPGRGKLVKIKKVAPDLQAFMRMKPHFILVVDKHWYFDCRVKERNATIFKSLTRIRVEDTDDDGVKVGLNGWDIEETFASLKASGPYNETTNLLAEVTRSWDDRALSMVAANIAAKKTEPEPEPEPEEKPRVVARSIPPEPVAKKRKVEAEAPERTKPPRKIPPDPVTQPAEEPEPVD